MKRIIKILGLLALFSLFFMNVNMLIGEEGVAEAIENRVSVGKENLDMSSNLIGRIVMYLMLLISIGVVIVYLFKQGKFVRGIRNQGGQLKVKETHVLGNRQFLVVVEYGKQRILLGVGPNMINQLCFLESHDIGNGSSIKNQEKEVKK